MASNSGFVKQLSPASPVADRTIGMPTGAAGWANVGKSISAIGGAVGKQELADSTANLQAAGNAYQMAKDAYTIRGKQAASEAVQTVFGDLASANNAGYGMDGDAQNSVNGAVSSLNSVKAAQGAGKIPLGSLDIAIEQHVSELMAKHPQYANNILTALHNQGFDHYLFKNLQAQQEAEGSEQKVKNEYRDSALRAGLQYGATGTDEQIMSVGAQIISAQSHLNALNVQKGTDTSTKEMLSAKRVPALNNLVAGMLEGPVQNLMGQLSAATTAGDARWADAAREAVPQINNAANSIKNAVLKYAAAHGMSNDDVSGILKNIDTYKASLIDSFSGKGSEFAQLQQSVTTIKDKIGLSNAQAYPLVTRAKAMFGSDWMDVIQPVLSNKKLLTSLKNELSGVDLTTVGGQTEATAILENIHKASQGLMKPIDTIPASQASATVSGIANGYNSSMSSLLNKTDTSLDNQHRFTGYYSTLLEASTAYSANPNGKDLNINSIDASSKLLFNAQSRAALDDFLKQTGASKETGEQLMLNSRATAIQNLTAVKQMSFGQYRIIYDKKRGSFVVSGEAPGGAALYTGFYLRGGAVANGVVNNSSYQYRDAQKAALVANRLLDHMVKTDKYDEELPQGATPLSRRSFWASGGDTAELVNQSGAPVVKQETTETGAERETPEAAISKFSSSVGKIPNQIDRIIDQNMDYGKGRDVYIPYVRRAAKREKIPAQILDRVIEMESRYDPNAKNPNSSATGLGQFVTATAKAMGIDPTDPYASIDATASYLKELKGKTGSWEKALDAYGVTAMSNFKTADERTKRMSYILEGVK